MIHHVYANQTNIGDWLSARGIQSLLEPLRVVEHFCDEPFVPETLAALTAAGPDDFIIIGGGGLFMDYFWPFWEGFRPIASRVPFSIWGVGYCDMKRQQSCPPPKLVSQIVRQSRLCFVRDELTREHLQECQLPSAVPCPSIVAVGQRGGEEKRLLQVDHYNNVGPVVYERMVAIAEEFAQRTGRSYRKINNLIPKGQAGALSAALDQYASADLVFSSRLHGCILALAMGRRVMAVSGDRKVESFMAAAGLSEWVCGLDEIDSALERLEVLPNQRIPMAFVEEARAQNHAIARRVLDMIGLRNDVAVST